MTCKGCAHDGHVWVWSLYYEWLEHELRMLGIECPLQLDEIIYEVASALPTIIHCGGVIYCDAAICMPDMTRASKMCRELVEMYGSHMDLLALGFVRERRMAFDDVCGRGEYFWYSDNNDQEMESHFELVFNIICRNVTTQM